MRAALVVVLWLIAVDCFAVSFLMFDPKTMGTSGAGSMTADGHPQAHTNPSTWSIKNSPAEFSIYFGARLTDRQNFIDTFKALEAKEEELKLEEQLQRVKRALRNGNVDATDLRELSASADIVRTEINTLPDKPLGVGTGGGAMLQLSEQRWSLGVFSTHYTILGAEVVNDPADLLTIERLSDTTVGIANILDDFELVEDRIKSIDWSGVEDLLRESWEAQELVPELVDYRNYAGVPELELALQQLETNVRILDQHIAIEDLIYTLIAANENQLPATFELNGENIQDYLRYPIPDDLNTRIIYSGAEVVETGVNFSIPIATIEGLAIGANLKYVDFSTVAFSQQIDEFDLDEYSNPSTRLDYGFWNMDLGLMYLFESGVHIGLAVKGIRHKKLQTKNYKAIELEPLVHAGVSYQNQSFKLALDADITKNEPLGFDPDKQYVSLGGEWFFLKGQALRLGYRYNSIDNTGLPSIGLGLNISKLCIDLAASYDEQSREAGVGLQLGVRM